MGCCTSAPETSTSPVTSKFFAVYHSFVDGKADDWWAMMMSMKPDDMAAMQAKQRKLGFHNNYFCPEGGSKPIHCMWETEKEMTVAEFQVFIDGPDGPGPGVFVNTVYPAAPGAMLPTSSFAGTPAAPSPTSGCFYWVYHKFQSAEKEADFFKMMATADMAAMEAKNNSLGFHNHFFTPTGPGMPVFCIWECKADTSPEDFQKFIDGPDGPGNVTFVNEPHKLMAGMAPPCAAKFPAKKGYVYGFFDMKNPQEFKEVYSPMAEPTLDPYEGKFVCKYPLKDPIAEKMGLPAAKFSKGFGSTGMMAFILEFPTFEKAMGWFTGPEYAAVLGKRDEVADFRMAVVEGAPINSKAGLVMGFFDMKDPKEFSTVYSPMAEPTLDPYGGAFAIKYPLVPPMAAKMGLPEAKYSKGFGTTGQMAFVLQFADFEKAMGWFTGPEYAAVLGKRDEVSDFRMAVVSAM